MKFFLGVICGMVLLAVGGVGLALLGLINTDADRSPNRVEAWIAGEALDASMERRAARVNNPIPATDENLIDGMKGYVMACAECHGGLDKKSSAFGNNLYPVAPQLIIEPMDDPEWHIFYAVKHGVRNTGMPAWKGQMSDQDIWKITAFLSRIEKLPPAVQGQWKKSLGQQP